MKTYSILLITPLLFSCERDTAPEKQPEPVVAHNRLDYLIGEYEYENIMPANAILNYDCHAFADFENGFTLVLDSVDADKRIRFGDNWYLRTQHDSNLFYAFHGQGYVPISCSDNSAPFYHLAINDSGLRFINYIPSTNLFKVEIHFKRKK